MNEWMNVYLYTAYHIVSQGGLQFFTIPFFRLDQSEMLASSIINMVFPVQENLYIFVFIYVYV